MAACLKKNIHLSAILLKCNFYINTHKTFSTVQRVWKELHLRALWEKTVSPFTYLAVCEGKSSTGTAPSVCCPKLALYSSKFSAGTYVILQ